ncbi:MAG: NAD(P)H-hydrate dehydratase [Eubacteriales bacterium]|nr:NAD(P)H-hydrate dehydratase [Eubacteriales bacterium]
MQGAYRLVTRAEQQLLDRAYTRLTGLPSIVLMENAGKALAEAVLSVDTAVQAAPYDCLIFAGKGQNGGDGYVAARHLQSEGLKVAVIDVSAGETHQNDAAANVSAWIELGGEIIRDLTQVPTDSVPVIIDAIFGSGFAADRKLDDEAVHAFALMSELQAGGSAVIACDLPSGLVADTGQVSSLTLKADLTVTFGRVKLGLITHPGCLYSGEIWLETLGMDDDFVDRQLKGDPAYILDSALASSLDQKPADDAHKGDNGKALLIGGSENMPGAMLLSIEACGRSGAGYTMVRAPEEIIPLLAEVIPSALYSAIPEGDQRKRDLPGPFDAIAIGMGASGASWISKALNSLIPNEKRLLIDADGLNALAKMPEVDEILRERQANGLEPLVLTPHPVEFERIAPELSSLLREDRVSAARSLALKKSAIVVLKGMATVIAFPDGTVYINESGNSGMAKAGSGDVLTGMIAGNMAVLKDSYKAVLLSVYLHGLAADIALAQHDDPRYILPEDILARLSEARQTLS